MLRICEVFVRNRKLWRYNYINISFRMLMVYSIIEARSPQIERLIIKSFFYLDASKFLYIHRILVQPTDRNYLNGIWGKLASEILMQNWDAALEDLKRLQQFIDESTFGSSLQLLQQRTWLIHWSLFVFFNHPKGRDLIIELFLYQKQYLNAIQTTCPWILRYLSTAVIINKNSR